MNNTHLDQEMPFWPDTLQNMSTQAHRVNFATIEGSTPFELLGAPILPAWDSLSNSSILSILTRMKRLFQIIGLEVIFKYAYPPVLKYRFITEYVLFQPINVNVLKGEKMTIHYEKIFPNHVETLKEECKTLIKCWTINIKDQLEPETVPANVYINGERTSNLERLCILQSALQELSIKWCGIEIDQVYVNWGKKEAEINCTISFMHHNGNTLISRSHAHFHFQWDECNHWQLRAADLSWLENQKRLRS
jgi:hypothetical protein